MIASYRVSHKDDFLLDDNIRIMRMGKHSVYIIFNKRCNKIYVGRSVNPENRFKSHIRELRRGKHHSVRLQKAFNKYGVNNFTYITVASGLSYKDAMLMEDALIEGYKSYQYRYGYNLSKGNGDRKIAEIDVKIKGVRGYSYDKRRNKWMARIDVNGKGYNIGYYETKELARARRLEVESNPKLLNKIIKDAKIRAENKYSQYVGVTYDKRRNKWKSQINVNNKAYWLGDHNTEHLALQARQKAEHRVSLGLPPKG